MITTAELLGNRKMELYGGRDPRELPRYTFPEASRATRIPASTLRSWIVGQSYRRKHDQGFFAPVIDRPNEGDSRLSFVNLIEAHVLRALREVHDVRLEYVRQAVDLAEKEFGIKRLLVHEGLRTDAGHLFLKRYSELLQLSPGGQYVIRNVLDSYLQRVEFDETQLPAEFFPFSRRPGSETSEARVIALSPFISFGRPRLVRTGVSTVAVAQRLETGESPQKVMDDYGITGAEMEEAFLYEAA